MYEMIITVDKNELLAAMRANRDRHRTVFEAALAGYRDHVLEILEEHIAGLREGRTPETRIVVSRPEDHTRDYDRVLGMLSMHNGDTFELDEDTYARYVDDDWAWSRQWIAMSRSYAPEVTSASYGR